MNDELKIIIKAILDENIESSINQQLKNLKIEPLSLDVKIDSKTNSQISKVKKELNDIVSRKVNKNPISLNIFKKFGIKNKYDKEEISKAVEKYQNSLKIGNQDEIIKSYEDLFAAIRGSFLNFTKSLEDHEQEFLNHLGKQKMYISPHIKEDLGKDNYKYYRQNLVGNLTTNSSKAPSPDVLYSEIYSEDSYGLIPHPSEVINDSDRFQIIADKIIELRKKSKSTYTEEDILWNFGTDKDIKNSIDKVINEFENQKPKFENSIKNIKSSLVDLSDPYWNSLMQNAPFDIFEKSTKKEIKVPFKINIKNSDELRDEMERIVADFTNNKGKLIDYKVNTHFEFDDTENKQIEVLSGAVLKYKNELDEIITKNLKWQQIGKYFDINSEEQAIMGFAESYSSYSQNLEKAIEKQEKFKLSTEKLENKLLEYKKSFEILQLKADKSGIKLDSQNVLDFNKSIDNKDLEKSRHLLTMLQKEWQSLNASMVKDVPNTALENMNKYISKMPYSIEAVELKLKSLSNPTKELQEKVNNLKIQLESIHNSGSNDEKLFTYGKLKQAIIEVNAELNNQIKIQRQINQDKNLVYDKKTFSNRITTWTNQNAEATKVFAKDIEKLSSQIENADRTKLLNLKKQFQEITTSAKSMGITTENVFEKLSNGFEKISSMIIGGSVTAFAIKSLKEVYENILAIDNAIVNVKKVTDETAHTYKKFISDSVSTAVKLGTSVDDIMNSTADFVRHGYNMSDAFNLSQTAAIFKNVSYTDIDTASTNIISVLRAFKIEAKDSLSVIDKLNDVGNKFSISSAGLAEGLRSSSSSLATANNTLDESLGLLTAANEVVQNPKEAGNAVKVLALRLRNTKGKLEEIGESTEGMVESVTRLQTQLFQLTNGKVNIMASPDTFKSTYQIMKEISEVWDDLTDIKKANVIELIAGKHRANVIISILRSMKTAEQVVDVSLKSQGSAMREQEKSMDSIHAKTEQMKASMQALSSSVLDSGLIKLIFDLGSSGLSNLTKFVDTFGSIPTILTGISTSLSLTGKTGGFFNLITDKNTGEKSLGFLGKELSQVKEQWQEATTLKEKIGTLFTTNAKLEHNKLLSEQLETDKTSIRNYISAIEHGVSVNEAFRKTMSNASKTAKNYAKNNDVSSLSVKNFVSFQKSLNSATKSTIISTIALTVAETALNAALTMGLSVAIEAIVAGIINLGNAQAKAVETANKLSNTYNEQIKSIGNNSKNIDSISKDYERLAKGVNSFGENVSLTNEEYRRYNEIANQIAEMFPELVQGRTLEGNAILKQKGNVEALTKALKEQRQVANDNLIKNQEEIFKGFRQTSFEGVTTWTTHKDALYQEKQILDILIQDIDSYDKLLEKHSNMDIYSAQLLKKVGINDFNIMSPKSIFESLTKNKNQVLAYYRGIVSEINAEISKIQPIMIANLENKDDFQNLDEHTQNYIRNVISAIDINTLSKFQNATQMNSWIDLNILQPITQSKDNVQENLSELLSLESQNLPADEYINAVNNLVNQIASTDDSAEAQKKRKELQEKLKKDEEDLQKFLYDNGTERQKKALDNEYNQFKYSTDKRIKVIEDYLHHEGQIRIDAMNLIEGKSQEFYNNLMRYNIDYGDGMTSTVIGAWDNAYSALSRFNSGQIKVANTLGSISGQISGIASQIESANKAMNDLGNTSRETAKALNLSAREYKNVNNEEKTSEITRLQRLIEQISTQRGSEPSLGYYKRKLYDLIGYASGTLSSKKGLATVDENGKEIILDKSSPGRYRLMNEGDVVFSHEATKKLWNFANSPNNFVGAGMLANSSKEKIFYNKNYNNLSSPIVNINIKGNADFETVNALKRESENIIKKAVEITFKTANKYAEII